MTTKRLKIDDVYLEVKYNDTNENYTNGEEYFLLPGNCRDYGNLCNALFREANLLYGINNKYIKEAIYDNMPVLAINHEKLLPVLSYFSSSPLLRYIKIKVTGPVAKRGKGGKPTTILETLIIDCSKTFDYKHADIFSPDRRKVTQKKTIR